MWMLLACAARMSTVPVHTAAEAQPDDHLRLIFIGDSGYLPDGEDCTWRDDGSAAESCHIRVDELVRLQVAIRDEEPDAVYGLGDLVYPLAPRCRQPRGRVMQTLAATVGSIYGDLDAPSYLVLGNHDVGHLGRGPRRERCLKAFADDTDRIELPGLQYVVDHGLATVIVPDSNLRRQELLPAAELQAALDGGGWVIVAAHHELRTAFEKLGEHPLEPPGVGEWLSGLGVAPHLWVNGHAHTLQLGVFDARTTDDGVVDEDDPAQPLPVLAVTSGAASKLRAHPTCADLPGVSPDDAARCAEPDPRGMPSFSMSRFGFVVVDLDPQTMVVRILDLDGKQLTRWKTHNASPDAGFIITTHGLNPVRLDLD